MSVQNRWRCAAMWLPRLVLLCGPRMAAGRVGSAAEAQAVLMLPRAALRCRPHHCAHIHTQHLWALCCSPSFFLYAFLAFVPAAHLMYRSLFISAFLCACGGRGGSRVRTVAAEMQVDKGNYLNTYRAGLTGLETQIKMQRSM